MNIFENQPKSFQSRQVYLDERNTKRKTYSNGDFWLQVVLDKYSTLYNIGFPFPQHLVMLSENQVDEFFNFLKLIPEFKDI